MCIHKLVQCNFSDCYYYFIFVFDVNKNYYII